MKGMKIDKFTEIVNFVQEHHKFAQYKDEKQIAEVRKLYPKMSEFGQCIKYIDMVYDSRFSDVWHVSFRGMGTDVCFHTNTHLPVKFENLYDWIMAYLTYEWVPTDEEYKAIKKEKSA